MPTSAPPRWLSPVRIGAGRHREAVRPKLAPHRKNRGPLDEVSQFPDVSGKVVAFELFERLLFKGSFWKFDLQGHLTQEEFGKNRYILLPRLSRKGGMAIGTTASR